MIPAFESDVAEMMRRSRDLASELEPWPGYFEVRANDFLHARAVARTHGVGLGGALALDVGAGIGFGSRLLTLQSDRVVAIDLPHAAPGPHSLGISTAGAFLRATSDRNERVHVVAGDVAALPFSARQFDVIFSSFALQYTSDRPKVFSELFRVLRPQGGLILLVPTASERLLAWLEHYPSLMRRALSRMTRSRGVTPIAQPGVGMAQGAPVRRSPASRAWSLLWPRADSPFHSNIGQWQGQKLNRWLAELCGAGFSIRAVEMHGKTALGFHAQAIIVAQRA